MRERIKYATNIPPEVLTAIRPHIERWAWLIPAWMQSITIKYANDEDDGTAIATIVNPEYRWGVMTFYPAWLEEDREVREVDVIHDLLHLSTNPIFDHACNAIKALIGEGEKAEAFFAIEENRLRELHEAMVQDIAHAIQEAAAAAP